MVLDHGRRPGLPAHLPPPSANWTAALAQQQIAGWAQLGSHAKLVMGRWHGHTQARMRMGRRTPLTPPHAQGPLQTMVDPTGWPARVRQQHAFQSHRLSTARTDHFPHAAVADCWRWWHLIGAVLEQL